MDPSVFAGFVRAHPQLVALQLPFTEASLPLLRHLSRPVADGGASPSSTLSQPINPRIKFMRLEMVWNRIAEPVLLIDAVQGLLRAMPDLQVEITGESQDARPVVLACPGGRVFEAAHTFPRSLAKLFGDGALP